MRRLMKRGRKRSTVSSMRAAIVPYGSPARMATRSAVHFPQPGTYSRLRAGGCMCRMRCRTLSGEIEFTWGVSEMRGGRAGRAWRTGDVAHEDGARLLLWRAGREERDAQRDRLLVVPPQHLRVPRIRVAIAQCSACQRWCHPVHVKQQCKAGPRALCAGCMLHVPGQSTGAPRAPPDAPAIPVGSPSTSASQADLRTAARGGQAGTHPPHKQADDPAGHQVHPQAPVAVADVGHGRQVEVGEGVLADLVVGVVAPACTTNTPVGPDSTLTKGQSSTRTPMLTRRFAGGAKTTG